MWSQDPNPIDILFFREHLSLSPSFSLSSSVRSFSPSLHVFTLCRTSSLRPASSRSLAGEEYGCTGGERGHRINMFERTRLYRRGINRSSVRTVASAYLREREHTRERGIVRSGSPAHDSLSLSLFGYFFFSLLAPSSAAAKGGGRNLPVAAFSPHRITPRGNQYARLPRAFFSPSRSVSRSLPLVHALIIPSFPPLSVRSRTHHHPSFPSFSRLYFVLLLSFSLLHPLSPTLPSKHPLDVSFTSLRASFVSSLPRARARTHPSCTYTLYVAEERPFTSATLDGAPYVRPFPFFLIRFKLRTGRSSS